MRMNIDVHNHFYPKSYLDELSKGGGYARVEKDTSGRLLVHYEGDYNIVVGPHIDIGERLKAMDRCGIEMHVLTLTTPTRSGTWPTLSAGSRGLTSATSARRRYSGRTRPNSSSCEGV